MSTVTKTITGLSQTTQYQYRVTAIGDGTTYTNSDPSSTATFTTLTQLATPTGVTAGSITNDSATISWNAVTNASSYKLEYKTSSASEWTEVTVNS